ncbi:MAG: NUDIX domain-containing protein [Treponemataceae bacterium]|nr:NUDIX domain-containing protein [Treponemataceae bacterium]
MLNGYFEDNEYEKTYIDHVRHTVRAILHTQNDTYLFVKVKGADLFGERNHIETIGGGVEEGEDLETALAREVLEESGYTVVSARPLGEITDFYNLIHRETHSHFFAAEVDTTVRGETGWTDLEKTLFEGVVELTADEALKILQNPQNPVSRLIYRRDILAFTEALQLRK